MTRKDYELLARAINAAGEVVMRTYETGGFTAAEASAAREGLAIVRAEISGRLAEDNPRFDAPKFKEACGV